MQQAQNLIGKMFPCSRGWDKCSIIGERYGSRTRDLVTEHLLKQSVIVFDLMLREKIRKARYRHDTNVYDQKPSFGSIKYWHLLYHGFRHAIVDD